MTAPGHGGRASVPMRLMMVGATTILAAYIAVGATTSLFESGLSKELVTARDAAFDGNLPLTLAGAGFLAYLVALASMVPAWFGRVGGYYVLTGSIVLGGFLLAGAGRYTVLSRGEALLDEAFSLFTYGLAILACLEIAKAKAAAP